MPSTEQSFRFTHAIVRTPAPTAAQGLRVDTSIAPDPERFAREHDAYVAALESCGVEVTRLPALDAFPDSVFVEDTSLCLPAGAIVLRPGAPSRAGEAYEVEPALRSVYGNATVRLEAGTVDGGDVLVTDREVIVGLSARTDPVGAEALVDIVERLEMRAIMRRTPPDVLHFKSDCAVLDSETVLATERLAATGCFSGYRCITVAPGEESAANAIRVNDHVILASGFPRTLRALQEAGYSCRVLDVSQARTLDGGLSCMSLRFTPPGRGGT